MEALRGKVALVTAGGRGLGAEIVRSLAREGAMVVINDVARGVDGPAAAAALADEIRSAGGDVAVVETETATWAGGQALVDQTVAVFRKLHFLVTCASDNRQARLAELDQEHWQSSIDRHLKATIACARPAARLMRAQGEGGRIVTIASSDTFSGAGPAAASAQAGIMGLTTAMSMTLQPHGVMVNCVLPSADTHLHTQPFAPLVTYLCTEAAKDITDHFFYISGADVAVYNKPLLMEASTVLLRKPEGWSVDDLDHAIRPLLNIGKG